MAFYPFKSRTFQLDVGNRCVHRKDGDRTLTKPSTGIFF